MDVRSDIRSRYVSAQRFAEPVRSPWSIENRLRRTALGLLKNETTLQVGIKNKRLNAGWDAACLQKVRCGS